LGDIDRRLSRWIAPRERICPFAFSVKSLLNVLLPQLNVAPAGFDEMMNRAGMTHGRGLRPTELSMKALASRMRWAGEMGGGGGVAQRMLRSAPGKFPLIGLRLSAGDRSAVQSKIRNGSG
jgi:hypothetical protein